MAPLPPAHHARQGQSRAQICAAEIGVDHFIPLLLRHKSQQPIAVDSGVVYQVIDRTKLLFDAIEHGRDTLLAGEIGFHRQRLSASGDDALDHFIRGLFPLTIVHGYAEPRASQSLRDGGADNPRRPGD